VVVGVGVVVVLPEVVEFKRNAQKSSPSIDLVVGFQVEKVTAVGQSKSNNVWI
jgi:hypothetical protein